MPESLTNGRAPGGYVSDETGTPETYTRPCRVLEASSVRLSEPAEQWVPTGVGLVRQMKVGLVGDDLVDHCGLPGEPERYRTRCREEKSCGREPPGSAV